MKKINIILAISAAALMVSCEKEIDFGGKVGAPIRFGAATGYDNGPATRTEYSGKDENNRLVQSTSQYERIDWVANTDRISILCNEVPGSTKILDYKITSATAASQNSIAEVAPAGEQFNWGSGAHYFFAMYPAPSQNGLSAGDAVLNDHGNHTVTISGKIPATQTVTLSGREYKANMNYAYMYAAKKVDSPESNVELGFKPLVTAFEFTLLADNTFPITSNLTKVQLSASTELAGNFVATIDENGFTGNPTTSNVDQTLTLNLGTGIQLSKTDPVKFTFLALPKEQTGLKLMLTFASGETRSLELKNNSGFITVDACKKVYIRSIGVMPELEYIFDTEGPSAATFIPKDGSSPVQYTVTSIVREKYDPSKTAPVKWEVIEYSLDNGATWTTGKPNWLTLEKYNDNGSGEYDASASANTQSVKWAGSQEVVGSSSNPVDLSLRTITGEDRSAKGITTANCYVITSPGYYTFPIIYGNAMKNGQADTKAYQTRNNGTDMLTNLVRHDGSPITNPWIHNNSITVNNATLVWQDAQNLVTDISLSDDKHYVVFQVKKENIQNGNAVIAVRDANNTIVWSWHIWAVPQSKLYTVKISDTNKSTFLSLNLGWYDSAIPIRSVKIRAKQEESGFTDEFTVQQDSEDFLFGGNVYYQWGRKDPMLGFVYRDNKFVEKTQYYSDQNLQFKVQPTVFTYSSHSATASVKYGWFDALTHTDTYQVFDGLVMTTVQDAITHPYYYYGTTNYWIRIPDGYDWKWGDGDPGHWFAPTIQQKWKENAYNSHLEYRYRWQGKLYHNLWNSDAEFDPSNNLNTEVYKTVYDPSPVGFKIPNAGAFSGVRVDSFITHKGTWYYPEGEDPRGLFFPATSLREPNDGRVREGYDGMMQYSAGHTWHPNPRPQGLDEFVCPIYYEGRNGSTPITRSSAGADAFGFPVRPIVDKID